MSIIRTLYFGACISILLSAGAFGQFSAENTTDLLRKANEYYQQGDYTNSERIYREALEAYDGEYALTQRLIAAIGLGASLLDQGKTQEGINWILKADSLQTPAVPLEVQAYIKSNKAWATWWQGNMASALSLYRTALELARQSGNEYRIAQISNSLSLIEFESGALESALSHSSAAVRYFEEQNENYRLSMALSNMFLIYMELGLTERAEKALLESLALKEKLGNKDLITSDYQRLGEFYKNKGEYDKSLFYLTKYLDEAEGLISSSKRISALLLAGSVYHSLGRHREALEFYEQSRRLTKEKGYRESAVSNLYIGETHRYLGNYAEAEKYMQRALALSAANDDHLQLAEIYINTAALYLSINNPDAALKLAEQAGVLIDKTDSIRLKAELSALNSKAYTAKKEYRTALSYARTAQKQAAVLKDYLQADYTILLSKAFYDTGSDSAFYYADIALKDIENIRLNIYGDNLQAGLFQNYAAFYNTAAGWYLENKGDVPKAFELIERGKSRALLDQLSSSMLMEDIADDSALIRLHSKEKEIDRLYRELDILTNQEQIRKKHTEILNSELAYENLLNNIRLSFPELKQFEPADIISPDELSELSDGKTAFLQYAFDGSKLYLLSITKNEINYYISEFSRPAAETVNNNIQKFRQAIENKAAMDSLAVLSAPLYDTLLRPFFEAHPEINQLFIIPDQSIAYLPFDALAVNGRYLIEDFNFKYLPSGSIYKYIKQHTTGHKQSILALAGAGFTGPLSNYNTLASLPASLLEIDAISKVFPQKKVSTKHSIPEAELKEQPLENYKYIHFATHALINELNPLQSGLLLTNANLESAYGEDGYLTSLEISSLNIAANLVVLSACNTGFGQVVAGEGLLGLQRSFLKAGATSVMVSLWSVYDRSTSVFMSNFYETMNTLEARDNSWWQSLLRYAGKATYPLFDYKADALREAKLAMLNHPYYNHPVYWAPFILVGK